MVRDSSKSLNNSGRRGGSGTDRLGPRQRCLSDRDHHVSQRTGLICKWEEGSARGSIRRLALTSYTTLPSLRVAREEMSQLHHHRQDAPGLRSDTLHLTVTHPKGFKISIPSDPLWQRPVTSCARQEDRSASTSFPPSTSSAPSPRMSSTPMRNVLLPLSLRCFSKLATSPKTSPGTKWKNARHMEALRIHKPIPGNRLRQISDLRPDEPILRWQSTVEYLSTKKRRVHCRL
ncbi:hypothetical protein BKA70DRAFT_253132 [Coprinopsis sp. MPI-PUGE-AT-0042]|nr:hypothetical protein BKA70DRAFT_253132 [Coprinopsis sp. MPI-PUGE-AT-0042]